jgi:hypothetical protein
MAALREGARWVLQIHIVFGHNTSDSDEKAALDSASNPDHQENPKLGDPSMFAVEWTIAVTLAWSQYRKCGARGEGDAVVYGPRHSNVLDPTESPTWVDMSVSSPASLIVRHA